MKNEINLPFGIRFLLFVAWPIITCAILIAVTLVLIFLWPIILFKASMTIKMNN